MTSVKDESEKAIDRAIVRGRKRRRRDGWNQQQQHDDDDDDADDVANDEDKDDEEYKNDGKTKAKVKENPSALSPSPFDWGDRALAIAKTLNARLPMTASGASGTGRASGVGACGAYATTERIARAMDEDEWEEVMMAGDYGDVVVEDGEGEGEGEGEDEGEETKAKVSATKGTTKRASRRLTDDERAGLLSTHHTHVMCLVGRGRLVSAASASEMLRAATASCAPRGLMEAATRGLTIEVEALGRLVDWFANAVAAPIVLDDDMVDRVDCASAFGGKLMIRDARRRRRAFRVAMFRSGTTSSGSAYGIAARLAAMWAKRGREEIDEESCAALFAAFCQGLGLTCRIVASLEPVPIRASAAQLESLGVLSNAKAKPLAPRKSRRDAYARHWCEVLCARHGVEGEIQGNSRWVAVAPRVRGSTDDINIIVGDRKRGSTADASSSMPYVLAFHSNLGARDVTRKYAPAFSQALHHRTPDWKWWDRVVEIVERVNGDAIARDSAPRLRSLIEAANAAETFEMDARSAKERVPGTMSEIKNHPLWVVERFLSRTQTIHPRHPVKGFIAGEAVFSRSCVKELKSAERWKSECRRRVTDECLRAPVRKVHSRALQARVKAFTRARDAWFLAKAEGSKERLESEEWRITVSAAEDCPTDPATVVGDIALYGEWQTEPWAPPAAVGGVVPKNDRGNVDLYGNALPPPGTVHVNLPRISRTAKIMRVDYAPALVGFEYKAGGKTLPVFNGIVVCEEFKDEILKQHALAEEARRLALEAKLYKEACLKWRLLLGAIWTRAALREEFQPATEPVIDHTAARIAAAKAMNEAQDHLAVAASAVAVVKPLAKSLGAKAVVEEL